MKCRVSFSSIGSWRFLRWAGLAAVAPALWACTSRTLEAPTITPTRTVHLTTNQKINNELDLLFMIDNSSSMQSMQQKLLAQLPVFMQVLQALPMGLPSLHVAVVSEDMGAHSDSSIQCTELGDDGAFKSAPTGACLGTTLTAGSTFMTDVNGVANFTDPIGTVFQCIGLLGTSGCGFEHQLASIDRALGADELGPLPSTNANFLRPEAYLGIVMLTNEDDASAPQNTTVFSLNGYPQDMTNPDGPLANYRQNGGPRGTHLCQDPTSANPTAYIAEPIAIPPDAQGTTAAPTLNLVNCKDNDSSSSAFTPVSQFVSDIKALKPDPDNQILVAGIIAPTTPVEIGWYLKTGQNAAGQQVQELFPDEMHSCGAQGGSEVSPNPITDSGPNFFQSATKFTTDGSFGDPGIREAQFIKAFPNNFVASICDPDYASSMANIAQKLGQLLKPPCITDTLQKDTLGNPICTVIEHLTDMQGNKKDLAIQDCAENGNTAPCWSLVPGGTTCPNGSQINVTDPANANPASESSTVECSLCLPGFTQPGC